MANKYFVPCFLKDWNVDFKVHAPCGNVLERVGTRESLPSPKRPSYGARKILKYKNKNRRMSIYSPIFQYSSIFQKVGDLFPFRWKNVANVILSR